MIYKSCNLLEHGIVFSPFSVFPCCSQPKPLPELFWCKEYNGELIDIDEYRKKRQECIELLKSGGVPNQCVNCYRLEEKDWTDEIFFSNITISHETKCSCNCFYCLLFDEKGGKNFFNTRKTYNLFPVLNDLLRKNLIRKNAHFDIAGGECTEYKNKQLEKILDIVKKVDGTVYLASSGIIYSKAIASALKSGIAKLCVSVDSGTQETYEKVKQVKSYKKVWNNLKKYIENEKIVNNEYSRVIIKYIILPGINDNINEIKMFLSKCISVKCKCIWVDIEWNWWNEYQDKEIPNSIIESVKYFKSFQSELPIYFVEKGVYLNNKIS